MFRLSLLAAELARLSRRRRPPATGCALALIALAAAVVVLIGLTCWLVMLIVVFKSW